MGKASPVLRGGRISSFSLKQCRMEGGAGKLKKIRIATSSCAKEGNARAKAKAKARRQAAVTELLKWGRQSKGKG